MRFALLTPAALVLFALWRQFRSALYEWKHEPHQVGSGQGVAGEGRLGLGGEGDGDGGDPAEEDPSDCIPLQLQRLFGQLQLSDRACVETRALTDSFGWTAQASGDSVYCRRARGFDGGWR